MEFGLILILTTVLLLVVIALVIFFTVPTANTPSKFFVPEGTILTNKYVPVGDRLPVTFYLPLQNLDKLDSLEEKAIFQKKVYSFQDIETAFSPPEDVYNKCLLWLQQYGQTWVSPSKTCGILYALDTDIIKMVGDDLYISINLTLATQNKIFTPPYGIQLGINSVYDTTATRKTMNQYRDSLDLINYDSQVKTCDYYSYPKIFDNLGITGQTGTDMIGLLTQSKYDQDLMKKAAVDLGYPEDQFVNNIAECYVVFNLTSPSTVEPQLEFLGQGAKDIFNPPTIEANLDCLTCCASRPYGKVISYNFSTQSLNSNFSDILPLIWVSGIKIFSCSYLPGFRFDPAYIDRSAIEARLLSLFGTSMFIASGDQGIYNMFNNSFLTSTFDISRPDGSSYINGGIKVGGFSTSEQSRTSGYNYYLPMQYTNIFTQNDEALFKNKSGTTSGGYYRGVKRPSYKNSAATAYEKSQLWKSTTYYNSSSGEPKLIPNFEIDFDGDIYPDICSYGNIYNNFLVENPLVPTNAGTSFSSPLTASMFQIVKDNTGAEFISLQRQLYTNLKNVITPVAVGNNGLNNVNGYQSNLKTSWDPVNGLGLPSFSGLVQYFS